MRKTKVLRVSVNNLGNQRRAATNAAGAYVSYTYDSIGQLKVANSVTNSEDRGYTYDAAWNLNYRTNNGYLHTFWVNGKNELTNSTVWNGMAYDANGNRTNGDGGVVVYDYDDENQLAFFEGSGELRSYFTYDGKGRLRKRLEYSYDYDIEDWMLTEETRYVYDGMRVIQERSSSTPLVAYTRGNDLSGSLEGAGGIGGLLARSHGYSSGNWGTHNFYHADGNGNITAMVNSSQSVVARYRYDAFGNSLAKSGSLAEANKYRFSSKEYHDTTTLYYYGYRWYDAYQQRWLNRDPIGEFGGINLFGFVENKPTAKIDAVGFTDIVMPPGGGAGGVGSIVGPPSVTGSGNNLVIHPIEVCTRNDIRHSSYYTKACRCGSTVSCRKGDVCAVIALAPHAGTTSMITPVTGWRHFDHCAPCPEGDYK